MVEMEQQIQLQEHLYHMLVEEVVEAIITNQDNLDQEELVEVEMEVPHRDQE